MLTTLDRWHDEPVFSPEGALEPGLAKRWTAAQEIVSRYGLGKETDGVTPTDSNGGSPHPQPGGGQPGGGPNGDDHK